MENTSTETTAIETATDHSDVPKRTRRQVTKAPEVSIDIDSVRDRFIGMMEQLDDAFVSRTDTVLAMALAMLTRQHYLLIGDPGTGKTALARCMYSHISNSRYFETTMGSFTPLDELVGPPDIKAFQAGQWKRVTDGRVCDVDYSFLDEAMKGSDATMNSLLTVLNERRYEGTMIPLRNCGSATNWPEIKAMSDKVLALYDRFLIRWVVKELDGEDAVAMVLNKRSVSHYTPKDRIDVTEMDAVCKHVEENITVGAAVLRTAQSIRTRLKQADVKVSDRRFVQMESVVKAHAWLEGRSEAVAEDLQALRFLFWNQEEDLEALIAILDTMDQPVVKACIKEIDSARESFNAIKHLSGQARNERRPKTITTMRNAAVKVMLRLAPDRAAQFADAAIVDALQKEHNDVAAKEAEKNKRSVSSEDLLVHMAVTQKGLGTVRKALREMHAEYLTLKNEAAAVLDSK